MHTLIYQEHEYSECKMAILPFVILAAWISCSKYELQYYGAG